MMDPLPDQLADCSAPKHFRDFDYLGAGDPGAIEALLLFEQGEDRQQRILTIDAHLIEIPTAQESRLIEAYRARGFLHARLDPLAPAVQPRTNSALPQALGMDSDDCRSVSARLDAIYCGSIGWEIAHLADDAPRGWLEAQAECGTCASVSARIEALGLLERVEAFEDVLRRRLPGSKLFSLAGSETLILALDVILSRSALLGSQEVLIGGVHRGRYPVLAFIADKPLVGLLAELQGAAPLPPGDLRTWDVPYHSGHTALRHYGENSLLVSVSPHPSHLQIVQPFTIGRARARQDLRGESGTQTVLPLMIHTDAALAGQGIAAEMLQLSQLPAFQTGGTIHLVIDNQIGFTTSPSAARSSRHCTDIARVIEAPVLHVNAEDADAVARVAAVAAGYRHAFARDIFIRLVGYRRIGHNELEDPRQTSPAMYTAVDRRSPVTRIYRDRLQAEGIVPGSDAGVEQRAELDAAFAAAGGWQSNGADGQDAAWSGLRPACDEDFLTLAPTGVDPDHLRQLGLKITHVPKNFNVAPRVARFLAARHDAIGEGRGINWATAEALAFASLLAEGVSLRFGGQDSVRGAFAQRHLALYDQSNGAVHIPLDAVAKQAGARCSLHDTPLTEYAVLAFEYGASVETPHGLCIWEAQFGDFLNIAQPVLDQFISCGTDRWGLASGLVILAPHGLDGGGPDHSTARPERLLNLCSGANLVVAHPSTPANLFHLLRRQLLLPVRVPLVVLSAKALLRRDSCVSALDEFGPDCGFRTVIPDDMVRRAQRVVLCSGKIWHELAEARRDWQLEDCVALVRVEQLNPLPLAALANALARHKGAELVWCEEEPENMGPFRVLDRRLEAALGERVTRVGRTQAATPAAGWKGRHSKEREDLLERALRL